MLQISGQEPQFLTGFHGRAGQHDAGDVLCFERLDGHGYSQISFAGTRRANAECNGILPDGIQVFFLSKRLGADRAALNGNGDKIFRQLLDPLLLPIVGEAQAVANGLIFQRRMVFNQEQHPLHRPGRCRNIGCLARKAKHRTTADCRNGEFLFQKTNVSVAVSKDSGCNLHAIQFNAFFCHVAPPEESSRTPSLLYHQNFI